MTSDEHQRLLSTATETTINAEDDAISADQESLKQPKPEITPLPKKQLFVLCWMRFSEPISYNLIFPFINQMIEYVGIENPGYSSGLIEGTFALAQLCTVYFWGSLSDRIGRRPVLLIGLVGVATFTSLFGLSTHFISILLFRFLIGACNGNVAVLKSAIAELTDETNQSRAFSFLPLSWSVGSIVAPIIGGFLARPAEQYPTVFGNWSLFVKHPYLLPCLAGSVITLLGWLAGYLLFEETLGGYHQSTQDLPASSKASSVTATPANYGSTSERGNIVDPEGDREDDAEVAYKPDLELERRMTASDIVKDPIIRKILVSYIFLAVVTVSIDAVWVLWLYMPISKGGVGFTTAQIGIILSSIGVLATFVNLIVFPPLQRRVGTVVLYRAAMALQVLMVALFPIVSAIAALESVSNAGHPGPATRVGIAAMVMVKCLAGVVFACNMILVSQSAPTRTSLGAVNGVAQMVASSMRAIGPSVATVLFALSTDARYHALGGQLIWGYMLLLAGLGVYASSKVQEGRSSEG